MGETLATIPKKEGNHGLIASDSSSGHFARGRKVGTLLRVGPMGGTTHTDEKLSLCQRNKSWFSGAHSGMTIAPETSWVFPGTMCFHKQDEQKSGWGRHGFAQKQKHLSWAFWMVIWASVHLWLRIVIIVHRTHWAFRLDRGNLMHDILRGVQKAWMLASSLLGAIRHLSLTEGILHMTSSVACGTSSSFTKNSQSLQRVFLTFAVTVFQHLFIMADHGHGLLAPLC